MDTPRKDHASGQANGVSTTSTFQLSFSFGEAPVAKPPEPNGQRGQVLNLIRRHQPVLSLELTASLAIPEAEGRVHDLRSEGWNVLTTIIPSVTFRGIERRNVAAYSLGAPEWAPPRGRHGK